MIQIFAFEVYGFLTIHMVTLLELEQIEIKVKKITWSNKDKRYENIDWRKRDRENEERNHRYKYRSVGWNGSVIFC